MKNSNQVLKGLIAAMLLEGNYNIKPPCYDSTLINPICKICQWGSKWIEEVSKSMGGNIPNLITINN